MGGTFDPIHDGHLRLALEACKQLGLAQVRIIPVNIPPHRDKPVISADHRVNMINLAINNESKLCIDLRELEKDEISYTINTVKSLREEFKTASLCLIVGHDAFNKINTWHEWEKLLDYVHIIVANRPGETIDDAPEEIHNWSEQHITNDISDINCKSHGYIYFMKIPMLEISSSNIRAALANKRSVEEQLPPQILSYIKSHNLYQDTA